MFGCEIWSKVGDPPPADYTQCTLRALDTRTPYVVDYLAAEGNKTVHYMARPNRVRESRCPLSGRWIGVTGAKGPWSETESASVGA